MGFYRLSGTCLRLCPSYARCGPSSKFHKEDKSIEPEEIPENQNLGNPWIYFSQVA